MTSTFTFGFSGDDIDITNADSDVEISPETDINAISEIAADQPSRAVYPATRLSFDDLIAGLPSQISYNTLKIQGKQAKNGLPQRETSILIARRELFDVRAQLMAEDDDGDEEEEEEEEENSAHGHAELIAGLEKGDLKPNFYEGGFKTWECALDLADVMLDYPLGGNQDGLGGDEDGAEEEDGGDVHVIELGCGTAVPSLMVFAQLVSSSSSSSRAQGQSQRRYRFTLADYNSTVLRMVTLSNFLLTWWINSPLSLRGQVTTTTEETETGMEEESIIQEEEEEGELDIDATLLDTFKRDLARHGIELGFIAGGWSTEFVQLALGSTNGTQPEIADFGMTFILASETIYSPSSLEVFSKTLLDLLRRSAGPETNKRKSVALIAAKKVYFGVGGGIDEFLQVLHQCNQDQESIEVRERREITSGGVKRVVLEIGIDKR